MGLGGIEPPTSALSVLGQASLQPGLIRESLFKGAFCLTLSDPSEPSSALARGASVVQARVSQANGAMGHANSSAALRYQHATADRDRVIAEAPSTLAMSAKVVPLLPRVALPRPTPAPDRLGSSCIEVPLQDGWGHARARGS